LAISYNAIHSADPHAHVLLGGVMDPGPAGRAWVSEMLATPGVNAVHRFDVANIHIRARAALVGSIVRRWRAYFARVGFDGPLWVTETGYAADPHFQNDPAYQGGAVAQAQYLVDALTAMIRAGATRAFVTERDSLSGTFASEGVLETTDPLTASPRCIRRPAFYAIRSLARRYSRGPRRQVARNDT
jgi:hypothetical protein